MFERYTGRSLVLVRRSHVIRITPTIITPAIDAIRVLATIDTYDRASVVTP